MSCRNRGQNRVIEWYFFCNHVSNLFHFHDVNSWLSLYSLLSQTTFVVTTQRKLISRWTITSTWGLTKFWLSYRCRKWHDSCDFAGRSMLTLFRKSNYILDKANLVWFAIVHRAYSWPWIWIKLYSVQFSVQFWKKKENNESENVLRLLTN